jgi:hypothetical protein
MKISAVVIVLLVFTSTLAGQQWRFDRAQVCFVRYGENGRINVLQSWIHISDYEVPIIGEQAICLYLEPGRHSLKITSTEPYDDSSKNTKACQSRSVSLQLKPGDDRTFAIRAANDGRSYSCGWNIAEEKQQIDKEKPH